MHFFFAWAGRKKCPGETANPSPQRFFEQIVQLLSDSQTSASRSMSSLRICAYRGLL